MGSQPTHEQWDAIGEVHGEVVVHEPVAEGKAFLPDFAVTPVDWDKDGTALVGETRIITPWGSEITAD